MLFTHSKNVENCSESGIAFLNEGFPSEPQTQIAICLTVFSVSQGWYIVSFEMYRRKGNSQSDISGHWASYPLGTKVRQAVTAQSPSFYEGREKQTSTQ